MKKRPHYSQILELGGKVSWPKVLTDWKIGQRVFLFIRDGSIAVTSLPSRAMNGRIFSTRIRRKLSSKNFAAT